MNDLIYFYPHQHERHASPGHPERPERIEAIVAALREAGWWEDFPKISPISVSDEVVLAVHSESHLSYLQKVASRGGSVDPDTYLTRYSWDLAVQATGGTCALAAAVWEREAARGFALSRPPGHHATRERAMGFCLLNNIAIAAEYLIQTHGAQRLAIVDLDVHHGNGTQDIFYQRGDVLFISTHQHPLYPGTGRLTETGIGEGTGATLNLPLPPFSGNNAFFTVMEKVILPKLQAFAPEMVLVSAGVDAHWRDPLAHLLLSGTGYHHLIRDLVLFADKFCEGRIALVLEGGYDLKGGSACALGAAAALLGEPFQDPVGPSPFPETDAWRDVVEG